MRIIDKTIKIVEKNVKAIKSNLKCLKFRNAKSGLYIYGRYTTYFISRIDLSEYSKDSLMYMQQLVDHIYMKEIERSI